MFAPAPAVARFRSAPPPIRRSAVAQPATVVGLRENTTKSACACGGGCPGCAGVEVQPKLIVGDVNDPAEREADAIAAKVMRSPIRSAEEGASARKPVIRRTDAGSDGGPGGGVALGPRAAARVDAAMRGGQPLSADVRATMEPRFGADFSGVRIHRGTEAADSAAAIGARAYTLGHNIAVGQGQWAPGTEAGDRLIAHELAHVVQAERAPVLRRLVGPPPPGADQISREVAEQALRRAQREAGRQVVRRAGWRAFWRAVARRFALRGVTMAALSAADGPLPIGELISLGLTLYTIWEIANIWDELWRQADAEVESVPEPAPAPQPNPAPQPVPAPRPVPRPDPEIDDEQSRRRCREQAVAQRGGNSCHDRFATLVSGAPREWGVETPEGHYADFDGRDVGRTLWETKTGFGWLLNTSRTDATFVAIQQGVRHRWVDQSEDQLAIATRCGYPLIWVFNNRAVADHADGFLRVAVTYRPFDCEEDGERGQVASGAR